MLLTSSNTIMSGLIENEMTNCLQQMAELQAKMEVLQEEKNNKAAEEAVKKQEVEPNLKVMSDWLQEYGELIDEVERERVIYEQYNKLEDSMNGGSNSLEYKIGRYEFVKNLPPVDSREESRHQFQNARRFGINLDRNTDISQLLIEYEPTKEEYELYNNREAIKAKYFSLKQSENRHHSDAKRFVQGNQTTSYFMKQYIESTHNMFLIQQKRINELEERLEKLKPKLSNEDFGFSAEDPRRVHQDETMRKINLNHDALNY